MDEDPNPWPQSENTLDSAAGSRERPRGFIWKKTHVAKLLDHRSSANP